MRDRHWRQQPLMDYFSLSCVSLLAVFHRWTCATLRMSTHPCVVDSVKIGRKVTHEKESLKTDLRREDCNIRWDFLCVFLSSCSESPSADLSLFHLLISHLTWDVFRLPSNAIRTTIFIPWQSHALSPDRYGSLEVGNAWNSTVTSDISNRSCWYQTRSLEVHVICVGL